jgi:hypothetical protein
VKKARQHLNKEKIVACLGSLEWIFNLGDKEQGKIGLIALKDHDLRKIPLKDPTSGKHH